MPDSNAIKNLLEINQSIVWLTDSGASRYLTFRKEWLIKYRPLKDGSTIALDNDEQCDITDEGTVLIESSQMIYGERPA